MMPSNDVSASNFVGGRAVGSRRRGRVINPASFATVVGSVTLATRGTVDAAVAQAQAALRGWAATSVEERQFLLLAIAEQLERLIEAQDLPTLLTREQGKIRAESAQDLRLASHVIRQTVELATSALREEVYKDELGMLITTFEPMGVVAAISPWNWPIVLSMMKLTPALLTGNTVVLKPAPNTPLAITVIVTEIAKALPPGVLNLVHGGGDIGAYLVSHPGVHKVSFTGSVASGRKVYRAAAANIKDLDLELGGNDPAILLDDVKVTDDLVRSIVGAAFVTTGQVCVAIKRLYVHEDILPTFLPALQDAVNTFVVGDGLSPDVTMGPLNNDMQFTKVSRMVDEARSAGAKISTVGRRSPGTKWDGGYFMLPGVATGAPDACALVQEEQFGPVLPVLSFSDVDEVVERANKTSYGLCASIWSSNSARAFELARRIESGRTCVNAHGLQTLDFGFARTAVKESGLGLSSGPEGLRSYACRRILTDRRTPAQLAS